MYPILETKRLVLKPLQETDFDDMFKLYSNPAIIATMEGETRDNEDNFKKDLLKVIKGDRNFSIRLKTKNEFIGFFMLHQYIDKNKSKIKYSQIETAFFQKYWGKGFCSEAAEKILHFAFLGVKTPWICANQLHNNPAAVKVLKKCGFTYYGTYKMEKGKYDQYRYQKKDYLKINGIDTKNNENVYNYTVIFNKSPYSFEKPIRKINSIKYIKEPTGYLCGQSVVAMLANVSVDEAIEVIGNDKGTSVAEIESALNWYGIKHGKKRIKYEKGMELPDICILSLRLPGYGHWSLYYKGTFYDPEFGKINELPKKAKLIHYWEIMN